MICFASFSETSSLLGSRSILSSDSNLLDSSSSSYRIQKKNKGAGKLNIYLSHTFNWHSHIGIFHWSVLYDRNLNHKVQLTPILQQNCTASITRQQFWTYLNQQKVTILWNKKYLSPLMVLLLKALLCLPYSWRGLQYHVHVYIKFQMYDNLIKLKKPPKPAGLDF